MADERSVEQPWRGVLLLAALVPSSSCAFFLVGKGEAMSLSCNQLKVSSTLKDTTLVPSGESFGSRAHVGHRTAV
jgi:hypothetical protein